MFRRMVSSKMFQLGSALAVTAIFIVACGSGGTPASPSPSPSGPTITITGGGVSPQQIRISVGQQVRFVNNDSVTRQINSDPFPNHGDCPPTNVVGTIAPGQAKLTGPYTFAGTCPFHEHTVHLPIHNGVILVGQDAEPDDDPPDDY